MTSQQVRIRVGGAEIPLNLATRWVADYTNVDINMTGPAPYAYPAYDRYESASNDHLRITDADLLAPALLNVTPKVRAYYGLQQVRGELEAALTHPLLDRPLAELGSDQEIAAVVRPFYSVLDSSTKPWGVNATVLSKVLHRKRPQHLVLHDKWVRACYLGHGRPVPAARTRTWADYMTRISAAIAHDLRTQVQQFEHLDQATYQPGELSHLRLLDILAWRSKGVTQTDDAP